MDPEMKIVLGINQNSRYVNRKMTSHGLLLMRLKWYRQVADIFFKYSCSEFWKNFNPLLCNTRDQIEHDIIF